MAKNTLLLQQPFSSQMEAWIKAKGDKSLAGLIDYFAEKSFAILFLVLMALPALPLPTGGVTHVTSLLNMLVSLQLVFGRKTIWLPKKAKHVNAGRFMKGKAAHKLITFIKWFERYSKQRMSGLLSLKATKSLIGVVILIFTVATFVAPPFSGLDTLPAVGVVVIALSLILEDIVVLVAGLILGCVGIGLELAAGTALYSGLTHFF